MLFRIKARLAALGKKQLELVPELAKRGLTISSPAELSNAINGHNAQPKAQQIVSAANEIIKEWEARA